MFFIKPEKDEHFVAALELLSFYNVAVEVYSGGGEDLYMSVIPDHFGCEDDVRTAEMAFQMNWHQGGKCPECTDQPCGCMVFTKPIKSAF